MQEVPCIEGLVVIDVVEGTAVASLPHMSAILSNRPPSFPSLQVALEWAKHTGDVSIFRPQHCCKTQDPPVQSGRADLCMMAVTQCISVTRIGGLAVRKLQCILSAGIEKRVHMGSSMLDESWTRSSALHS